MGKAVSSNRRRKKPARATSIGPLANIIAQQKFPVIYIDPPWRFKTYNEKGRERLPDYKPPINGAAARHYDTMALGDMKALPVGDIAADDCALLMWVTFPMIPEALELIAAWGFKFKTVAFTWMKRNAKTPSMFIDSNDLFKGTGYWTMANAEIVFLATRGQPKRKNKDVVQAIFSPRREHSRKPDEVYERIERLFDGPYLEMFSRTSREGWTSWGNQTQKFPTLKSKSGQRGDPVTPASRPGKRKKS